MTRPGQRPTTGPIDAPCRWHVAALATKHGKEMIFGPDLAAALAPALAPPAITSSWASSRPMPSEPARSPARARAGAMAR